MRIGGFSDCSLHYIHTDMTPEEIRREMSKPDGRITTMDAKMPVILTNKPPAPTDIEVAEALFACLRSLVLFPASLTNDWIEKPEAALERAETVMRAFRANRRQAEPADIDLDTSG